MIFFSFIPYERENKASHRIAYFRDPISHPEQPYNKASQTSVPRTDAEDLS